MTGGGTLTGLGGAYWCPAAEKVHPRVGLHPELAARLEETLPRGVAVGHFLEELVARSLAGPVTADQVAAGLAAAGSRAANQHGPRRRAAPRPGTPGGG